MKLNYHKNDAFFLHQNYDETFNIITNASDVKMESTVKHFDESREKICCVMITRA